MNFFIFLGKIEAIQLACHSVHNAHFSGGWRNSKFFYINRHNELCIYFNISYARAQYAKKKYQYSDGYGWITFGTAPTASR